MAYRSLYNPLSQFVDPGSTEIGEELKKRYLNNFGAVSELETELANFIAAPFESDKKYRNEIVQSTQQTLNNVAERGDYENMTVPVMRSANRYSKESAPIKQNYALYADYVKRLGEAYDEGSIDYEDYQGTLALSNYSYKGIQRDAQGNYSNLYSGLDIITDPKIEERINEALKGIVAEEGSKERQSVGQGPGGQYTIKTEQGFKTVSKARVQQVMDMVMSDPQVREYINRKAQIRYGMADESVLAQERTRQLEGLSALRDQYEQAANETKDKDTKQAYLDAMNSIQARAGKLASMQDPEQLRAALMTSEAARIDELYRRGAEARFSYFSQTKDSRIVSWDQKYLKTLGSSGASGGAATTGITISAPGKLTEYISPSGTTITRKRDSISNVQNAIKEMKEPGYFDEVHQGLTYDQLLTMTKEDFMLLKGPNVQPEQVALFNRAKSSQQELLNEEYAIKRAVEEAGEATGETMEKRLQRAADIPELRPMINHFMTKYNVDEAEALQMSRYFLNEDDMLQESPFTNWDGSKRRTMGILGDVIGWLADTFSGAGFSVDMVEEADKLYPNLYKDNSVELWELMGPSASFYDSTAGKEIVGGLNPVSQGILSHRGYFWENLHDNLEETMRESDKTLNEYLKNPSTRQYTPTVTTKIPGMTKGEIDQINALMIGSSPTERGVSFVSGRSGNLIGFDEFLEEQNKETAEGIVSVGRVRYNPGAPGPHGATMEIDYKVGDELVTGHIPLSQIQGSPAVDRYIGSVGNAFFRAAAKQRQHSVEKPIVTLVMPPNVNPNAPDGMELSFSVDLVKNIITAENGPMRGESLDLLEAIDVNGYINAELPQYGFTIVRPGM